MFCSECGSELPDGSKFCNACGAQQKQYEEMKQPVNQTEEQGVQQSETYMQANLYGQMNPYMQQNPYGQMNPYMQVNPYAQPNPYLDPSVKERYMEIKKQKRSKALSVFAKIVSIIGILVNAVYLFDMVFKFPDFSRMETGFRGSYSKNILVAAVVFSAVSLITYIIVFFVKKPVFTCYYPISMLAVSIVFFTIISKYVSEYRNDNIRLYGYSTVPEYISGSKSAGLLLVVVSILMLLFFVLHYIKGAKWPLWLNLLLSVAASAFGLLAIGRIANVINGFELVVGNYFGYTLVALILAYAYASYNADSKVKKEV